MHKQELYSFYYLPPMKGLFVHAHKSETIHQIWAIFSHRFGLSVAHSSLKMMYMRLQIRTPDYFFVKNIFFKQLVQGCISDKIHFVPFKHFLQARVCAISNISISQKESKNSDLEQFLNC